jgi:hypothetical protein
MVEMWFFSYQWRKMIKPINIKPVQIIGACPAGVTFDDLFQVDGMNLKNPKGNRVCFLAVSHFPIMVWQLQGENRFFAHASCPGCIKDMERENRVVFLLAHDDRWSLSQIISEYLRLSKSVGEPEVAKRLKIKAIGYQNRGEYTEAEREMEQALTLLKDAHNGTQVVAE